MSVYRMVQGDTTPPISAPLSDEAGLADLEGATVLFKMEMVPEAGDTIPTPISSPCTVDTETSRATYEWQAGDTDTPGVYRQEFFVTFADDETETFPSEPNTIIIREQL